MSSAPTFRPAQGFTSSRAQTWVLGSALITALIYGFRRTVEGISNTPQKGKVASLLGSGAPAPLAQWAVAYGTAYLMLAVLALGAPELAASLAMMAVVGNVINNGISITTDIAGLEGGQTVSHASKQQAIEGGQTASHVSRRQQAINDARAAPLARTLIPSPAPYPGSTP